MIPSLTVDGNWVDLASVFCALLFALVKYQQRGRQKWVSKRTAYDFATGTSLFPMLMLTVSVFSSTLLAELLQANKLTLSVAGLIALLSILEDEFEKDEQPMPAKKRPRRPSSTRRP